MSSTTLGLGVPFPKMLPITGTWTLPLAIYGVILSGRTVAQRGQTGTMFGTKSKNGSANGVDPLELAGRAHANFVENVPIALLLAGIAELNGANKKTLNYMLATLFVLRVMHVEIGLKTEGNMGVGRPIGYFGTQGLIVGLAGYAAYLVKGYWGY